MHPDLVFITGASRSGTTVLSRALGNHSKILALNELHFFGDLCCPQNAPETLDKKQITRLAGDLLARQAHGLWGAGRLPRDEAAVQGVCERLEAGKCTAYDVFAEVCLASAAAAGKSIACEQTPRNIYYARTILDAFPRARILHIIRDPRAVAASQKNRWQLRRLGASNVPRAELIRTWINYHPVTMAKLWKHATVKAGALIDHPRVRIVRFEDLARDPRNVIEALCGFLGIEFEDAMLDVPQWGSSTISHETASGITSDVIDRWTSILDRGEVAIMERLTGKQMALHGYPLLRRRTMAAWVLAFCHLCTYPLHLAAVIVANPRRAWIQVSALFGLPRPVRGPD